MVGLDQLIQLLVLVLTTLVWCILQLPMRLHMICQVNLMLQSL